MGRKKIGDGWKSRQKQHQKNYVSRKGEAYRLYQREWKRKNSERLAFRTKERKYGVSESEIVALFVRQGGECIICHREIQLSGHRGLHIDHSHRTGKVRGLLCRMCNIGLGMFEDDPVRLSMAMSYLEEENE